HRLAKAYAWVEDDMNAANAALLEQVRLREEVIFHLLYGGYWLQPVGILNCHIGLVANNHFRWLQLNDRLYHFRIIETGHVINNDGANLKSSPNGFRVAA